MSVGTSIPLPAYTLDPAFMARTAEALGFESIWYAEHPDPAREQRKPVSLGRADSVDLRPFRRPVHRVGASLRGYDHHQAGDWHHPGAGAEPVDAGQGDRHAGPGERRPRFLFGIGAGWNREETEIFGGDFDHRWTQTREAVDVMKELWTKDEAEFHGTYYDFPPVKSNPKPVQQPHPPVILGGLARRVLHRVATWGDGWLPNRITPSEVEASRKRLDELAEARGRDPKSLTISVYGQAPDGQLVQDFLNAGADRVVVRPEHCETEEEMSVQMERMAEAVIR